MQRSTAFPFPGQRLETRSNRFSVRAFLSKALRVDAIREFALLLSAWAAGSSRRTLALAASLVIRLSILASLATLGIPTSAQAATALEQLAASMAPGTWAQLSVANQNSVLGVGSISGSMIHYCNAQPWNPVTKKIEIIGMDHNWGHERYVQYDMATNSFVVVSADTGFGGATRHCYDHTDVNPYTGIVYHRLANVATGVLSVRYTNSGSANFAATPDIATGYDQIAIAATWWSGPFVGAGNQGAFIIYNGGDSYGNANDGHIVAWDPVKSAWIFNKHGMSPNYATSGSTYHSVMKYSPQKNVAVFGGGNDAPAKLWRLNADGTSVAMPNVPSGKGVGIQKGNLINDPVTGNFLLLSAGQLWELNPDGAGTWTQLTGTRSPPAGVGNPTAPDGVISTSIPDYGVVAYIKQSSSTGGTFFLYKHAVGGPADTTAPTVSLTAPVAGTVSGTVTVSANAADNASLAGVQFKLDGAALGAEDTGAPYSVTWDTTTVANGSHTLTAVARDAAGNQTTASSVVVTVNNVADTTPSAFSFTPQSGAGLNTAVTSNTVTPSGYNAATAISVSGGSYSVNGSAFVSSSGTLSPGQNIAVRLTTSPSNSTQTCATLTIGGVAGQFCATTQAAVATGGQDFATRCAQSGVLKCVGFDQISDFNTGSGGTNGAYGQNSGILPPSGTSDYTRAVQDTGVKASGGGSLRFTIPSNSGSDTSGSYFANFSSDLSTQFGAGEEFYVQWRQRFSPEFLNTVYAGGGGWKQVIVGTGDKPGTLYSSCSTLELPVQNTLQRGFPQMYNSCSGSASHGPYDPFEVPYGSYDFKLQNGRSAPYCLYSQSGSGYFAPGGNCFGYVANEWMTFQMRVQIGPRVGDEFQGSTITLWGAREGQPSELLIQHGPYNLTAGSLAENQRYGKIWLLPYHTGKSSAQAHPTAYTWYDELVISRNKIEDPPLTQAPPPTQDTTPNAFGFTSQTGVAPGAVVTSNTITPTGYTSAAPISVTGGSYSINGGAYVTTAGTINPGQSVAVRIAASSTYSTTTGATLSIGGIAGTFTVTTQAATVPPPDTTPDAYNFNAQTDVTPGAVVTSNTITPTGYTAAAAISVTGGSVSVNGGAFVTTTSTISPGQTVAVRMTTSASNDTQTCATLSIGGVSGQFCATTAGSGQTIPPTDTEAGLDFPSNNVSTSVRFRFPNPQNNGLPQYGPNGGGVTYIWKIFPRHQNGYYTTFFWGQDNGAFGGYSYYGAHPYPDGGGSSTSTHKWEISVNGGDFVTDKNGNNTSLGYNQWYTQALRVWKDSNGQKRHEFYWSLPDTSKVITYTADASYGEVLPPNPALTFGDAPWSQSNEMLNGILRGLQIYNANLTPQDIVSEIATPRSTAAGNTNIWYLNLNPTPSDISDKSGKGHNPEWVGSARPTLYTGGSTPPPPVSDTTPNAFAFTAQTGIVPGTVVTSNTVTPAGYDATTAISVSGGSYSINGGAFVSSAGTINPGQTVAVRLTASSANSTSTTATLTIGGVSGTFAVTTQAAAPDTTPTAFSFASQTDAAPGAVVTSNTITPTGYNAAAAISVSGGSYSINGGAFVSSAGTINPGQTVAVRLTTASTSGGTSSATLAIGGVTGAFAVTTKTQGAVPDAPTNVTARIGINAVTVKFAAPASDGGSPITGYSATCVSSNGGASGSNTAGAGARSVQVSGLTNGKKYSCTAAASNEFGTGPQSSASNTLKMFDMRPILSLLLLD